MPKAITMIITLIGAPGLLGLPTPDAERNEKPLAQKAHPDERPPSNDAPTSRSLMFATTPQKDDGCGGEELLVRHHDDSSCSCESPQDACMQDKDCYADQSCSEEGGSEGPQKMTYSSGKDTPSTSGKPAWLGYTKPITKLFLVGYGDDGPSKGCQDRNGELVSTADLNQRAGGRYIYLCASRRPFGRGSAPAVTDVRIQTSSSCPAGWKSPEKFDGLNGDLNQGAGGKDIFMCYKTGNSNSGWEAGDLYSVRVVTGKDAGCPSGSTRVTALDGLDGDLNQWAGGDFIYLCQAPWYPPDDHDDSYSYYYYEPYSIGQGLARAYGDSKDCN